MISDFAWLLKNRLKLELFFVFFCHHQNNWLLVTSICLSTSAVNVPLALVMKLPKIQDCRADIVRAAKIKILDPFFGIHQTCSILTLSGIRLFSGYNNI